MYSWNSDPLSDGSRFRINVMTYEHTVRASGCTTHRRVYIEVTLVSYLSHLRHIHMHSVYVHFVTLKWSAIVAILYFSTTLIELVLFSPVVLFIMNVCLFNIWSIQWCKNKKINLIRVITIRPIWLNSATRNSTSLVRLKLPLWPIMDD